MLFYPDIITLPEKHPTLKVALDVWESCSGGKNLYVDLEFHPDDEMRKACMWFADPSTPAVKSFKTIKIASFLMITPDGDYDNAILVNRLEPEDPDAYICVNTEFADNFVCTRCAICRTRNEVEEAICKVEGRLKEILQKYKKHLIKEAANVYTV